MPEIKSIHKRQQSSNTWLTRDQVYPQDIVFLVKKHNRKGKMKKANSHKTLRSSAVSILPSEDARKIKEFRVVGT